MASNKSNMLLSSYKKNVDEIDKNAQTQKNEASASYQRLLKYLPEYNASMGITGGVAESAMLRAGSDHASRVAQIESDAATQKNAARRDYEQNVLNSYSENYALASDMINNWNGSSVELDDYVKGLQGNVSDEQYNSLLNMYKNSRETVVTDETETAKKDTLKNISADYGVVIKGLTVLNDGNNFKMKLGDDTYKVQLGALQPSDSKSELYDMSAKYEDGTAFVYDGQVYFKGEEGIYKVEKRTGKQTGNNDYTRLLDKLAELDAE